MIYEKNIIRWKQIYKHSPTAENTGDADQWNAAETVGPLQR